MLMSVAHVAETEMTLHSPRRSSVARLKVPSSESCPTTISCKSVHVFLKNRHAVHGGKKDGFL